MNTYSNMYQVSTYIGRKFNNHTYRLALRIIRLIPCYLARGRIGDVTPAVGDAGGIRVYGPKRTGELYPGRVIRSRPRKVTKVAVSVRWVTFTCDEKKPLDTHYSLCLLIATSLIKNM